MWMDQRLPFETWNQLLYKNTPGDYYLILVRIAHMYTHMLVDNRSYSHVDLWLVDVSSPLSWWYYQDAWLGNWNTQRSEAVTNRGDETSVKHDIYTTVTKSHLHRENLRTTNCVCVCDLTDGKYKFLLRLLFCVIYTHFIKHHLTSSLQPAWRCLGHQQYKFFPSVFSFFFYRPLTLSMYEINIWGMEEVVPFPSSKEKKCILFVFFCSHTVQSQRPLR